MKLTDIAKEVLKENEIKIDDLSKQTEVPEFGLEFLKSKIDKLNKKAARWNVPPIELKVLGEREDPITRHNIWGKPEVVGAKKYYKIAIEGKSPQVEGFTFIGKVQHTTGGENILNLAPNSPIKNLPEIFKTAKGECDVCKEKRERFNTFILRMDREDPEKFPDKHMGDLLQIGSACLKRFLPGVSVDALLYYARIIEELRQFKEGSVGNEWDDEGAMDGPSAPDAYRRHVNTETLMKYIILVYNARGKFISRSKAGPGEPSTADEALDVMFYVKRHPEDIEPAAIQKMKNSQALVRQSEEMAAKTIHWMKQQDLNSFNQDSQWANYYHNLNVVAHAPSIDVKNAAYLAGVLQVYLRVEKDKTKQEFSGDKTYIGKVGEKIEFNGLLKDVKVAPSPYGGNFYVYKFEDLDGNSVKWVTNKDLTASIKIGERYPISGLVKKQAIDMFDKIQTTTIKNGKILPM